jgi:hypothetical protein
MVADSLYWTTADLDVMPDDGGWLPHEIIAGELFVTRAPIFVIKVLVVISTLN